jgi:hypothetical protein
MVTKNSQRKQAPRNSCCLRDRDMAMNELVRSSWRTMEKLEDSCRWEFTFNDIVPRPPSRTGEHPTTPVAEKTRAPQPTPIIKETRIPLELQMVFLTSCRWEFTFNDIMPRPPSRTGEHPTTPVVEKTRAPQPTPIIKETRIPLKLQMQRLALSKRNYSRWESGPRECLPGFPPSRSSK